MQDTTGLVNEHLRHCQMRPCGIAGWAVLATAVDRSAVAPKRKPPQWSPGPIHIHTLQLALTRSLKPGKQPTIVTMALRRRGLRATAAELSTTDEALLGATRGEE